MASQNQLAFRKWWWLVPIAVVIGIAGAIGSLQLVQKEYSATCRLFVAIPPNTNPGDSFQAAQLGETRVAAYLDLIKSNRVAVSAINSLNLDWSPRELEKELDAKADAQSVLMNVSVTDSQPQRSADLANAVCKSFLAVAADAEGPNSVVDVRLIEDAAAPENPVSPNPKKYLALGGLTGLLAGIGLVIALGRLRAERERAEEAPSSEIDGGRPRSAPDGDAQIQMPKTSWEPPDQEDTSGAHRVRRRG
jgi:capsular polysaccharide biosynthesis protein